MNEGWELTTLGKLTSWKSGGTPPKSKNEFWGGDIPWISASSMGGNRYRTSKLKVTQLGVENGAKLAKRNNLLLLVRGSILHQKIQVGIATRDLTFNQDVKALTVREDIDPWFILAWLRGNEWSLLNMVENTGIGAGKLDTTLLQNLPLHLPPIEVRKQITLFFKSIDKKIHLLRQQNATLESMAQALFKSWFVDFDPVIDNALEAGRVLPEALGVRVALRGAVLAGGAYSGLPEEVKGLFPDSFVFSDELGKWVPEGWTTDKFSESVTVKYGKDHKKLLEGPYPVYGSGGLMRRVDSVLYDKESVLIPRKGTLSNVMYVNEPFWSVDTMFYTILKKECLAKYVFYFISKFNLTEMNVGSAVPSMTTAVLNNLDMLLPDSSLLELFDNKVEKFYLKKQQNVKQIQTLTRLRDVLLPELISGRLGV
jgi:type I restriction enzyme S subunit